MSDDYIIVRFWLVVKGRVPAGDRLHHLPVAEAPWPCYNPLPHAVHDRNRRHRVGVAGDLEQGVR